MIFLFSWVNPVWLSGDRTVILDVPTFLLALCLVKQSTTLCPGYHYWLNSFQLWFHSNYRTISSIVTPHKSIWKSISTDWSVALLSFLRVLIHHGSFLLHFQIKTIESLKESSSSHIVAIELQELLTYNAHIYHWFF